MVRSFDFGVREPSSLSDGGNDVTVHGVPSVTFLQMHEQFC